MRTAIGLAVAVLVLAGAPNAGGPAHAREERGTVESADARLQQVVRDLMTQLYSGNDGIVPGLAREKAIELAAQGARIAGEYTLALSETSYKPKTKVRGTLNFFLGNKEKVVDEVTVALNPPPYDLAAMARVVVETGKSLGLELEADDEDPNTYVDYDAKGRELWVSLGSGVVIVEADLQDEE